MRIPSVHTLLCLSALLAPAAAAAAGASRPPNIVFFLCDDLGTGDVAALGSEDISTPNIDALFARGTRLSRHWAGSAVCAPSRCVLMTGKHPGHAAVRSNREVQPEGQFPLPAGTVTLAKLLHDAGYATGGFGKWGLGGPESGSAPLDCGFDEFFGYNCQRQAHSYEPDHLWDGRQRVPLDRGTYSADLIAARQLDFIRRHAERPFFLYVPTTVPHLALQVPADEPSLAAYERHFGAEEPYPGGKGYVLCARPLATYAAMITRMDREVGRIVASLEKLKIADDTIFVFTSDNGATRPGTGGIDTARLKSNGNVRDWKGSAYEGGLRVPTVAVWPEKIPAGGNIATPTGFEDWLPTLLDLVGLRDRVPAGLDGVSLAPALRGASASAADRVLYRELSEAAWQAATDGRWKVVRRAANRQRPAAAAPTELYDLVADPSESRNVAAEQPAVVRRMEAILDREHVPDPAWPLPFADARAQGEARLHGGPPAASGKTRPNVVLFLADDLGYGELGCYGNAQAITPNLDRFAAEGLKLTDCHSACPVCSPSRAALLTGRHPYRTGVFTWIPEGSPIHLPAGESTLPKLLHAAGYDTCHVGKWHLNGKFNSPEQPQPGDHGYAWWLATQNNAAPSHAFPENFVRNGRAIGRADDHSAPFVAREAVEWLKSKRDPAKPFFLAVWTHEPHYPIASAERYEKLHAGSADPVERTYRANVTQLDDAFGTVMKALDDLALASNTLVFFTSDNGPEGDGVKGPGRGLAGGLRERKRSMYEGGHRVPGLVRFPGRIEPGAESDLPVIGSDFFPTVLAVAGLEPPAGKTLDGVNLLPALVGGAVERPEPLYWRWGGKVAYREDNWKIVADEPLTTVELYDLAADRNETTDLAAREPARLAAMLQRLRAHTAEIEAEGPDWWKTEGFNGRRKPRPVRAAE